MISRLEIRQQLSPSCVQLQNLLQLGKKSIDIKIGKSDYWGFGAVRRTFADVTEDIRNKTTFSVFFFSFNYRLQDLFQQEKGRKRPSVPPSPGRLRQGEENKVRKCSFGVHFPFPLKTASLWLS